MATSTKLVSATARKPPNAGKGRQKGSKNKISGELKEAILEAARLAGGEGGTVGYLQAQALLNPQSFLPLLGKVLPLQIGGDPNNPVPVMFQTVYEQRAKD